jgi:ipoprotein LpqH
VAHRNNDGAHRQLTLNQSFSLIPDTIANWRLILFPMIRQCRRITSTKEKSVKRGFVVAVAGAAVLVAGLSGCSKDEKKTELTTAASSPAATATTSAAETPSASAGAGTAKVTIDGQPQNINGQVVCATAGGNYNIAIGEAATGIAIVMSEDASQVKSVGLGNVNGVTLGYTEGVPGGANATATKDGNNIKVTGTATGVDMANPMQPVNKPFEIEVTCP